MNINIVVMAGVLGKGETKEWGGTRSWKGTMIVVDSWQSEKGPQKRVNKIPIEAFGKNAMLLANLAPGQPLKIDGKFQSRDYTSEKTQKEYTFYSVVPTNVELLGPAAARGRKPQPSAESWEADSAEEAPF